ATLAYWTANRRSILQNGDTVQITGTHLTASVGGQYQCIMPRHDVRYVGRRPNDAPINNAGCGPRGCTRAIAVIDTTNETNAAPCYNRAVNGADGNLDLANFELVDL